MTLAQRLFMAHVIYLDNSATTILDPRVREAMLPYLGERFANASSIYSIGREARVTLEEARATIARTIGADPAEIVFTSGGTESDNFAIKGAIFSALKQGKSFSELSILTSPVEHQAVLAPIAFLSELGVKRYFTSVDTVGSVSVDSIPDRLTLASVMFVNNEVGTINDITSITSTIKSASPQTLVHSDAVQALGKIRFDVHDLGVDLLSLSAHKIHGPKGIGALYIRRGIQIEPLLHGGSQERNRRGGTEAVGLIVGFAEAARIASEEFEAHSITIRQRREQLLKGLSAFTEVVVNSPLDGRGVNGLINISFKPEALARLDAEALLFNFDLAGIAVSNGAACTSGTLQPSHVLLAMGKGDEIASKSIRLTLSAGNTASDIDTFLAQLKQIVQ